MTENDETATVEKTAPTPLGAQELADAEKKAAAKFSLDYFGKFMIGAWVLFVVGLLLPHGGVVHGWQVLTLQGESLGLRIGIVEEFFVIVGTLGVVVFGGCLLLTRRTIFANISFLLTGIALFSSLLAMWMRLQDKEILGGPGLGVGLLMEVAAVIVATFALSYMILRRSDEQVRLAEQRQKHENLDEVGYAQRAALVSQQQNTPETNPLFIDDRRQQAVARHKKRSGSAD
ncbi:hypothetical protein CMUST_09120 [Corynebacterium mustelae]|uniref:Uncharacterized protein n=1 Tax=Corynebacterium mustelae TaxID=571915 RepID=A0A0G3GYE4_9CORY|nr:hypothetical protein [Corynebacterium mustelae]AKK06141.1 hypothetical protein CMUST_09120 [Corynebacterium mustelae]